MAETVKVTNMSGARVGYNLEDLRQKRSFTPGETKEIPKKELEALGYDSGGTILLKHYLRVEDEEVQKQIGINPEENPEYNWTEKDVDECLLNGSTDRLADALEFGPEGIKELIEKRAVDLKIDSVEKRNIISKFTGLDIQAAIQNADDEDVKSTVPQTPQRRERRTITN